MKKLLLVLAFLAVLFFVPFLLIRRAIRKARKQEAERMAKMMQYAPEQEAGPEE